MPEEPIVEAEPKNEQSEKQESAVSLFSKIKTKIFNKNRETSKRNKEIIEENEADPSLDDPEKTEIKNVVETAQTETEKVVQEAQARITQLEAEILVAKEDGETIKMAGLQKEKQYQENKIKIAQKQEKLAIAEPETRQAKKTERNIRQKQAEQETFELQKEIASLSQKEAKSESNTEVDEIRKEIAEKRQELQTAKFATETEKTIGQKAGDLFTNKEVGKRFVFGQAHALATSLGVRTVYSLPAWLWQKGNVEGDNWLVEKLSGNKKGLAGQLQEVLVASQRHKERMAEKKLQDLYEKELEKIEQNLEADKNKQESIKTKGQNIAKTKKIKNQEAAQDELLAKIEKIENAPASGQKKEIQELMKVVKMTKEGGQKNSDLRNELARAIKKNRHENSQLNEEETIAIKELINKHAETKINGLEVARDGLNSACVLGGAWHLRIFSKGLFDAANRYQRLKREAKPGDEKVGFWKDAVLKGATETFQKVTLTFGKDKTAKERGLEFAQAASALMSYYGMGVLALRPEAITADIGRLVDTFSNSSITDLTEQMEQNIFQNAAIVGERYLKIAETATKPVNLLFGGTAQGFETSEITKAFNLQGLAEKQPTDSPETAPIQVEHTQQEPNQQVSIEQPSIGKNSQVAELFNAINDNPENPNYIETHDKIFPGNEVVLTYNNGSTETIIVKEGDNLWNIAKAHNPSAISEIGLRQGIASQAPSDLQEIINKQATSPASETPSIDKQPLAVEPLVSKPEFIPSDHQEIIPPAPQKIGQSALGQIDADTSFDYKEQHSPSLEAPSEQTVAVETTVLPANDKKLEELFNGEEKNKDNIKFLKELSDPNDKASINEFDFKKNEAGQMLYKPSAENDWQPLPKNLQDLYDDKPALEKQEVVSGLTHEPMLKNLPEVELPSALTPNQQGVFEGPFKDLTPDDISSGKFLDQAREDFPILEQGDDLYGNYLEILDKQEAGAPDNSTISEFKKLILQDGPAINEKIAKRLYEHFDFDTSSLDKPEYLKIFLSDNAGNWGKSDKVAFYRLLTDYQTIKELKKSL